MRFGLMRDIITIKRKKDVETEYAGKKTEYLKYIETKAQVVHNSGRKILAAGEIFTSYTVQFSIQYYHMGKNITPDMIIVHRGIKYRILDINPQHSQMRIIITGEIING
ncbi:MAG: phage head closure protein [Prevotellaceae bacterium]|jgi:SPP1 family predicted phage head-tail adaptor|nr:phage head closure protein [Prevotellaceae bacterium]